MINPTTIERINTVLLYIDAHIDDELSLQTMAEVGCYSPFHLHRLFKAVTGEALNAYINRKRIEKIAWLLINRKDLSVSELSLMYGFSSNSSLTRAFTKFYGLSPTAFRKQLPGEYSKIGKVKSKSGQESLVLEEYVCNINNHLSWIAMNANISLKELPAFELAFVTHIGTADMEHHFDTILKWARPKGLLHKPNMSLVRVYHDSMKITQPEKIRTSAGISLEHPVQVGGEVGLMHIDRGNYVVGNFEIPPEDLGKAWDALLVWMTEKGYSKSERDPFEIVHNNYRNHPEGKCIVDLCVPID